MDPVSVLLAALALTGIAQARSPIPHTELFQTAAVEDDVTTYNEFRLEGNVLPRSYDLRLSVDMENMAYTGQVFINCVANEAGVERITLSSQDLIVMSASVVASGSTVNILQGNVVYDNDLNYIHLNLNTHLLLDLVNELVYTIEINFQANLRNDMYGLYRSWYMHNGEARWMATTQFQATSARAAFPCFDEPRYKATFDISIERPAGYNSWSNMRLRNTETLPSGRQVDHFHTTPIMSTYLLAVIVAEYASLPVNNEQNELVYEVIARPNSIDDDQGLYALDIGQRLLAEMDSHTGIPYDSMAPNMKMTQAAIPDFSAGAMENWGLLTYREAYLMYHPEHTSKQFQQIIAYILSHEIAHMWFGNLVTCRWWDALWLNEGFARYYQFFLTDWVDSTMGFETRFITDQVHTALMFDSVSSAHALTNPAVSSPSSVSAHFSSITYNKGASVIRMTEHLLGFEVHRQGLQNYLRRWSFDTAVPSDLSRDLQDVAVESGAISVYGPDFNMFDYYNSWTEQPGHPVLVVNVNHQTGDMSIRQWRFDINSGYSSTAASWIVPITFTHEGNPNFDNTKPTHILRDTVAIINRGTVGDQWVIFNKQQTGFYRVHYDDYTWGLIARALRSDQRSQIHEYNRAQIVDDVCQFARSGIMDYNRALSIMSFLELETDYAPWLACISCMGYLRRRFIDTPLQADFESRIISWSDHLMSELTYTANEGESWMRAFLRYHMSIYLCGLGVPACRAAAVQQFAQLRATPSVEVDPDNRQWVYCNALREGTADDFNFLWNRFLNHPVYTEKMMMLSVLGCTRDPASLATFLNSIMSDTTTNWEIRPQDYGTAMTSAITSNEENPLIVFNWIQNNWDQYSTFFPNVAGYINTIVGRSTNENQITTIETWLNANEALVGANAVTSIRNNIASTRQLMAWVETISSDVASFIDNGYQEVDLTTVAPEVPTDPPGTVTPPDVEAPEVPEWDGGGAASLTTSFVTLLLALAAGIFANRQ